MGATYDPNLELNPSKIIVWGVILFFAALGTVGFIIQSSEMERSAPAAMAQ